MARHLLFPTCDSSPTSSMQVSGIDGLSHHPFRQHDACRYQRDRFGISNRFFTHVRGDLSGAAVPQPRRSGEGPLSRASLRSPDYYIRGNFFDPFFWRALIPVSEISSTPSTRLRFFLPMVYSQDLLRRLTWKLVIVRITTASLTSHGPRHPRGGCARFPLRLVLRAPPWCGLSEFFKLHARIELIPTGSIADARGFEPGTLRARRDPSVFPQP